MEHDKNATQKDTVSANYSLKTEAVETLANTDAAKVPDYSKEELNKYRSRGGIHLPNWLKMIGIKAWFAGAVCFFFLWGLGTYIGGLDMLVVTGIALGMVTDLLTNNTIRFLEKTPGENDRWMMIPPKGVRSFVLNLLYACVVLGCVFLFYNVLNYTIITVTGAEDTIPVGVEPLLFGLLCMGFDMLLIGIKRLLLSIIRDAQDAARSGN